MFVKRASLRCAPHLFGSCLFFTVAAFIPGPARSESLPQIVGPTGVVTLATALSAALHDSPELASFSAEMRAREGDALQSGLLPDPELQVEVEDFAGSGAQSSFNSAQTTIRLAQLVELGGKRSQRLRLANLERDLAAWDYEVARLNTVTRTSKAFVAVLAAQQGIVLAKESLRIADLSIRSVDARVNVGGASPIEALRAKVARDRAAAEHRDAERELATARIALAASWGSSTPTFERVDGDLESIREPPALAALLARIAHSPELARWTSELAQREANVRLQRAVGVPDVTVGLGGRYYGESGSGAAVLQLSVPLPIFNGNQGAVMAAGERLARAKADQATAEVEMRAALAGRLEELRTAYEQARALRDHTIPQAQAAFEGALDAYRQGLFRYIEALDAQRTLYDLRVQHLRLLATYHNAVADVERLSGGAISDITE